MKFAVTAIILLSLLCAQAVSSEFIVRPDGTGDFMTIQDAIANIDNGDVVTLSPGTFAGDGNRDIDFMGKAITIHSQNNDPNSCVIDCEGSFGSPHRGFKFHSGENNDARLEGVTITNGYIRHYVDDGMGGGILCINQSSPTINNCILQNNYCDENGGALHCADLSDPVISYCTIRDNVCGNTGGGIEIWLSSPTITYTEFISNEADFGGGFCYFGTHAQVSNCNFIRNEAENGAAILGHATGYELWVIRNCLFIENVAEESSIVSASGEGTIARLLECTFIRNVVGENGVVFFGGSLPAAGLKSCTFYKNTSPNGIIRCLGGAPTIENTIISHSIDGSALCEGPGGQPTFICSDLFANEGGNWVNGIDDQLGTNGNISEDPSYCDASSDDLSINAESPCAPFSPPNPDCDTIGAWPVGCGNSPIESVTWGRLKSEFRKIR